MRSFRELVRRFAGIVLVLVTGLPATATVVLAAVGGGSTGRSVGHPSVSAAGEASYSIPFEVPPGTRGLTPALSLEYRHGNLSGSAGVGWSIGGLSRITRCPRTVAQDGVAGPVTQTSSDRFCLDGQRLVVANGLAYGSAGAEYRTEIESYARIRSYGTAGTGPQHFVIEAQDGRILEYGATADSRIDWAGRTATPRAWALNRIRDRSGNAIDLAYVEDSTNGSYRVASVAYNGNATAGLAPTHQLAFVYENRPASDVDLGYVAGSPVRQVLRLDRVDVLHGNSVIRRYDLDYEPALSSAGHSRLAAVRECGAGGAECFAPTELSWQSAAPGLGAETAYTVTLGGAAWIAESKRWWAADINGDGRDDLVWAGGSLESATIRFRLALATGGHGPEVDTRIAAPNGAGVPLDYDGDGARDALLISPANQWRVVKGGAGGLATVIDTGLPAAPVDYRGADLDGDGLSDLVYSESVGTYGNGLVVRVRYNRAGAGFSQAPVTLYEQGYAAGYESAEGGEFLGRPGQRIDLDGDGREDLLLNENYSLARISADQQVSEAFDSSFAGGVPADVNGDGCTDFAYPHYQGRWRVRFSGCTVLGSIGPELAGPTYGVLRHAVVAMDWDGDGRDDLLYGDTSTTWKVVRSAGDTMLSTIDTGVAHGSPTTVAVADTDGDGLQDLVTRAGARLGLRLHAGEMPDLLLSVRDGFGVTGQFLYATLTDPAVYTKGSGATYPERDVQDGRTVVSRLAVSDGSGLGTLASTSYAYAGLRQDRRGRGGLGFSRRAMTSQGIVTEQTFRQDHPFTGLSSGLVARRASGATIREFTRQWGSLAIGSGNATRRFPYTIGSQQRLFEPGGSYGGAPHTTVVTSTAAIDAASGLVTDSTVTITEGAGGENAGASRSERVLHTSVFNDTSNWCLGRLRSSQVTASHTLPGGAAVTRRAAQDWDGYSCRPTRQQVEPGDPQWQVTVDFGYDAFGNISRRTVTGAGMTPRTTALNWGARGRFPISIANALSQAAAVAWDESAGRINSFTDPNGLTTRWAYDAFGRLSQETRPDGTRSAWTRAACASGCDSRGKYQLRRDDQDAAAATVQSEIADVDQFERAVRLATLLPGGGYSEQRVEFDDRGRTSRTHVPVWSGSPQAGHWQFRYDDLDRPVSAGLNGPGGAQQYAVTYSYDGLTGTETDPRGHRTTQTRNAWGDVASVRDALGGTTRYQHNPFGMLSEVKDAYGNVVSGVRYNARGMKISQSDMDLGAWTLSPNALGEITSRTDAKGQTTSFAYDLLGRPVRWTEAEGVTTLTWGASAPARNIGQLAALAGPGYSESYAFDAYSRLVTRSITSDATYQYGFSYNALGRLDTLTYPASAAGYRLALGYEYAAGQVVRIRDRGTQGAVLWQLGAVDARGNGLDETLGGSLRIVSGFGQLTGQMEYRQAGFGGGTAIQDLTFGWDHTGNLVERRDARRNLVERFTYDAANRLDLTVRNGVPGVDLSYDLIGNVTWKSDVCPTATPCFSYHATRKHAVSTAGANSYAYDANGNMTSRNGAQVAWYSFNLPKTISQPGGNQSEFWYGPARNRWKQVATNSGVSETTLYVGGLLEKVTRSGAITWRHYIQGPDGTAAIHLRFGSGSPARTYYLTRDHQGSTDRIVDPLSTSVVVAESFDPFGRRRGNGGTGVPGASEMAAIQGTTRDGFTGHEHLDNLGLIHMNGRVYDPVIGRFMSADPVVQAPFSSQDLNRYSYAWNNPLSVVDPNGLEEVQCLHGPHGKCQGVTVTGMRDWPDSPAAYSLWRTGSNGQATSAAQRDPCGQDGSAMDCAASSRRAVSGAAVVEVMPGRGSDDAYDAWTGIGRAALNLVPGWYYSGQAGSALQSGNYLDAALFYGATVSDVFLLGRGAATTIVSRAARNEVQLAGTLSYGPANPGPLSEDIAATFRSSSYRARRLEDPMIVYRVIGARGNPAGRFWTATEPKGALQSVIDLAIDQNWRNPATRVIQAEIPVGTLIYEGATAPQRGLVGGIEQIYIPRVDPRWLR